jgi:hypothetical protein
MSAMPVEVAELEVRALAWPDRARAIVIADDATFVSAGDLLGEIKSLRKEIDATFDPIISKQYEAHREAIGQKKRHETPLIDAEAIIKRSLGTYREEQERERREEQARLQEEARRREEDVLLAAALEAERDGDAAAAEEIISTPVAPPPVSVAPPTPKVAGVQFREVWTFGVMSLAGLVKHVAAHPEDINLLTPNMPAIRQLVNSRKSACRIPGVKVWVEQQVAARSSR